MAELALKIPTPVVEMHALRREELAQLRDHLLRLDTECRFERFGHALGKAALAQYAARSLDHGDLVIGYFVDGVLRGAGELHGLGALRVEEVAEAAFSVEKGWRGQGVGAALFERLLDAAQALGSREIVLTCHPHNRAMQALARKYAAQLSFDEDAVTGRLVARRRPALATT